MQTCIARNYKLGLDYMQQIAGNALNDDADTRLVIERAVELFQESAPVGVTWLPRLSELHARTACPPDISGDDLESAALAAFGSALQEALALCDC